MKYQVIYLNILKSVKISKKNNKLKALILAHISRTPQISQISRWIKVTVPMKKYKSSERIFCKCTMFEL